MIASFIRAFSKLAYKHPSVPQNVVGNGPFGRLKVALVADYLTSISLAADCCIRNLTPGNFREVLLSWRPDLVFVESAFHGVGDEWRYKLQKQPLYLNWFPGRDLERLVDMARSRHIPILFWNKDDKAFFDAFIDVARLFPHVFTTDADCLPKYRERLPQDSKADFMGMPYQPAFHNFTGFNFECRGACFVGSYYRKILKGRRGFLDMIFDAATRAHVPMHIFDRNSGRFSHFFEFRYPEDTGLQVHPGVPYPETAKIYKMYTISLNVNSIADSRTMYSRRLLEIIACGGICVTNHSPVVAGEFGDFCHIVHTAGEACEILASLAGGPSPLDRERAEAGARHVRQRHSWQKRLEELADKVNF